MSIDSNVFEAVQQLNEGITRERLKRISALMINNSTYLFFDGEGEDVFALLRTVCIEDIKLVLKKYFLDDEKSERVANVINTNINAFLSGVKTLQEYEEIDDLDKVKE